MNRELFNQDKYKLLRKQLRNNTVKSERIFWQHLKGKQIGFKFRRQHGINNYVVDFYCPEIKLVVEIDGLTHAEEKVFDNDQSRQRYLEGLGLTVKRYPCEDVFNNLEQVLEDLYQTCVSLKSQTPPLAPPPKGGGNDTTSSRLSRHETGSRWRRWLVRGEFSKTILLFLAALFISGMFLYNTNKVNAVDANQTITVGITVPSGGSGGGTPPTPPPPADTPPVISNVASSTSYTSALVSWSASDDIGISTSSFVYGLSVSYGTSAIISGSYQTNIVGLAADTLYYFKISVIDTGAHTTVYAGNFKTAALVDITPPVISNIQVFTGITTSAINWTTDEPADSQINYGLTNAYGSIALDTAKVLSRSVLLFSLLPNSSYHYRIISTDAAGNAVSAPDAVFTTGKDNIPPPDVSNLILSTSTDSISLSWQNPSLVSTPDFAGAKAVRKIDSASTNASDGTVVYAGSGESFTDSNVLKNINYFYTIFSYDTSGNYSGGVYKNGKIIPVPLVEICNNGVDDDINGQVDCADSACAGAPECAPPIAEVCNNGIDDDVDGKIDCADADCSGSGSCAPSAVEICNNAADDDADNKIDCADPDCFGSAFCGPVSKAEICDNGIDDDGNGLADCADSACVGFSGCVVSKAQGEVKPPESTVPSFSEINLNDVSFLAGNNNIRLYPVGEVVTSLSGRQITVVLPESKLANDPVGLVLRVGGDSHQFTHNISDKSYSSSLIFPGVGETAGYIEIDYGAGQTDVVGFKFMGLPLGEAKDDSDNRIKGVQITLFNADGSKVSNELYGESNPLITGVNGNFGWMAPNGEYLLTAEKNGYYSVSGMYFKVVNNVVNQSINLVLKPPSLLKIIDPNASIEQNIKNVAENLVLQSKAITKVAVQKIEQTANNPQVEKTTETVVVPTAITVVAAGSVAFISWMDLLPFLRLLFLQPLMLFKLRRREKWGLVYNSLNKLPIDLAIVRLLNAEDGRLVQSKVTNSKGQYFFIVNPGKYKLEVQKNNFIFPSVLLAGFHSDGKKVDIYHGEIIEVTEKDVAIAANLPLDPVGVFKKPARLAWEKIGRGAQMVLSWAGIIVTAGSLYISPKWYIWALLFLHLILFLLFRKLAMPSKTKSWGIVYDARSKKPVSRAIARLFNVRFNKLVATEVSDSKGRYSFLAGDDQYYVAYDHKDYLPRKTDIIDLTGKESETIDVDAELDRR